MAIEVEAPDARISLRTVLCTLGLEKYLKEDHAIFSMILAQVE